MKMHARSVTFTAQNQSQTTSILFRNIQVHAIGETRMKEDFMGQKAGFNTYDDTVFNSVRLTFRSSSLRIFKMTN